MHNWLLGQAMVQNALSQSGLSEREQERVRAEARTKGVSAALGLVASLKQAAQARLAALEARVTRMEERLDEAQQSSKSPTVPYPRRPPYPDPETADMTEAERLAEYKQTETYKTYRINSVIYELRSRYRVTLDETSSWDISEIEAVARGISNMSRALGGHDTFTRAIGEVTITLSENMGSGALTYGSGKIEFLKATLSGQSPQWLGEVAVVHELAHAWAFHQTPSVLRAINFEILSRKMRLYVGNEEGPTKYGKKNWLDPAEEWAESVAAYVYPQYIEHLRTTGSEPDAGLGPRHREFIERVIERAKGR